MNRAMYLYSNIYMENKNVHSKNMLNVFCTIVNCYTNYSIKNRKFKESKYFQFTY